MNELVISGSSRAKTRSVFSIIGLAFGALAALGYFITTLFTSGSIMVGMMIDLFFIAILVPVYYLGNKIIFNTLNTKIVVRGYEMDIKNILNSNVTVNLGQISYKTGRYPMRRCDFKFSSSCEYIKIFYGNKTVTLYETYFDGYEELKQFLAVNNVLDRNHPNMSKSA